MAWSIVALLAACAFCLMRIMMLLEGITTRLDNLPRGMTAEQLGHEFTAVRNLMRAGSPKPKPEKP